MKTITLADRQSRAILTDMRAGRTVLVITAPAQARDTLEQLATHLSDGERCYRANGEERIVSRPTGGWIRIHSTRSLRLGASHGLTHPS